MKVNNTVPIDEQEYKRAYENHLLSIKRALAFKNETHKMLYGLIEDLPFVNLCLGDFYYSKFVNHIIDVKPKAKEVLELYVSEQNLSGQDLELYRFYEKQFEDKLLELNFEKAKNYGDKRNRTLEDKFKYGVVFATENIEQYLSDSVSMSLKYSSPKVAKQLKLPTGSQKYILGTFNDRRETSYKHKNIFRDYNCMIAIHSYCLENNREMTPLFLKKLDEIKEYYNGLK